MIPGLVAQVVGNPAIRINIEEMLLQSARKEPRCNGEVFVVAAGQALAISLSFLERWSYGRDRIFSREIAAEAGDGSIRRQTVAGERWHRASAPGLEKLAVSARE